MSTSSSSSDSDKAALVHLADEDLAQIEDPCAICLKERSSPVTLACSHTFCALCILRWFRTVQRCPLCRDPRATGQATLTWSSPAQLQRLEVFARTDLIGIKRAPYERKAKEYFSVQQIVDYFQHLDKIGFRIPDDGVSLDHLEDWLQVFYSRTDIKLGYGRDATNRNALTNALKHFPKLVRVHRKGGQLDFIAPCLAQNKKRLVKAKNGARGTNAKKE